MSFDFATVARAGLPAPAPKWTGFPEFNFVGGHNDPGSVPVDELRRALDHVLAREGANLATYFLQSGPLGYQPLRAFLADKQRRYAGMTAGPDEYLLTSGSLQAIDLINGALLDEGDTVIVEQSNYGGVFPRLARIGARMITIPVDEGGMDIDALDAALTACAADGVKPKYI
ncbi:MAG: aminotransferase class I/II-fold pyridoxal phosphate-dependent enzyme, partial [Pseudomonadota bacterium]